MDFSEVNFGAPAAERDIAQGLEEYFVESAAFSRVSSGEKTIVLGNRGAGKSAIFKIVAQRERDKGSLVIELSPEDYSYEMLSDVLAAEGEGSWAKMGAYSAAWKYLIYLLVMRELMKGPLATRAVTSEIRSFLSERETPPEDGRIAALVIYLQRMEAIKLGRVRPRETGELARLYRLEELQPYLPALGELLEKQRVLVLVDELDRGWDASEDAKAFVAGLFQACVSLNGFNPGLSVYMSLRQELYDNIPELYDDAQKYRDLVETIRWQEPQILKLMANRIRYSVPALSALSDDECWESVFASTLQYRNNRSFNYMVDRTLYRPREIIAFATDALEAATDGAENDAFPIDYSVLSEAEVKYSGDRTRDVAAEYRFQYPGLLSVFEVFRGRTFAFDRAELEELCFDLATGEARTNQEAAPWVMDAEPEALIEVLWRVGFLRAQAVGGVKARRRSGSSYLGPHQVSILNLPTLGRFQVHPMFRAYLGMKEAKS